MESSRRIGVALALVAAIGAIAAGIGGGLPGIETFWRAALSAAAGYLLGWLVFGKLGAWIVREAAGRTGAKAGTRPPAGT